MYLDKLAFLKSNKAIAAQLLEVLNSEESEVNEELFRVAVAALYDNKQKEQALRIDGKRLFVKELQTIISKVIEGK